MSDAARPTVRTERADGVATVVLDRPDAMNALDTVTKDALRAALEAVAGDDAVRAVVLTGAGPRAFCVGQDLREHAEQLAAGAPLSDTVAQHYSPVVTLLATMPKPVVAAVNGVAAGAGAGFAFACDFRVVADTAGFNLAFTAIGLSADSGTSWSLPRLVGTAKAKELLMLPRTVSAAEALGLGLVTRVVAAAEVHDVADALARQLADGPTLAYAAVRRAIAFSAGHALDASLAHEGELMGVTGATDDHRGAVEAFLRKEKPVFGGR